VLLQGRDCGRRGASSHLSAKSIDPHSVDISTVPGGEDGDPMIGGNVVPSVAAQRHRCKHGNTNRRAWWTHATDRCWTVHEEPT
jgi:hypothetical protein